MPLLCCLFRGACFGGSHPCIRSVPPKGPLTRKFYGAVANVPQQICMLRIWLPSDLAMNPRAQMRLKRKAAGGSGVYEMAAVQGMEKLSGPLSQPCAVLACCGSIQDYSGDASVWMLSLSRQRTWVRAKRRPIVMLGSPHYLQLARACTHVAALAVQCCKAVTSENAHSRSWRE